MPGNQPCDYPHPANLPLLSAMAAVTTNLQLIATNREPTTFEQVSALSAKSAHPPKIFC